MLTIKAVDSRKVYILNYLNASRNRITFRLCCNFCSGWDGLVVAMLNFFSGELCVVCVFQ